MPDKTDTPVLQRRYTLNGTPVDLGLLLSIVTLDPIQMLDIGDLEPGQEMDIGGEGCLPYLLRRVA